MRDLTKFEHFENLDEARLNVFKYIEPFQLRKASPLLLFSTTLITNSKPAKMQEDALAFS